MTRISRLVPLIAAAVLSTLSVAPSAWAISYSFDFLSAANPLGTSQSYTNNGLTITAYGFTNGGTATHLYIKTDSGDENGLGLTYDGNTDFEIDKNHFVALDLQNLWLKTPTALSLTFGSAQAAEDWSVYGSNTLGTLGTLLLSGTQDFPTAVSFNSFIGTYKYFDITENHYKTGDILLNHLAATAPIPEPEIYAMMAIGLALMGFVARRRQGLAAAA